MVHRPDILIVQECEHPDKLVFNSSVQHPNDFLWFGDNKHKGLGIFSYSKYKFQIHEQYNLALKIIAPISVSGGDVDFILFGIWANNHDDPDGQYVEQIWKAIHHYDQLLNEKRVILIGDFNSNKIWDKKNRIGNHSEVVEKLAQKGIKSIYHEFFKQAQGTEAHPTFFLQRNRAKPYHIDYCFASMDLYQKIKKAEIGNYEDWINHSDHLPLTIAFDPS